MKILVTGFDPFGGAGINPAWEAVKMLDAPSDTQIFRIEVPTVFDKAAATVCAAIREYEPDAVMCVGQAAGRSAVTPERVAINFRDARIPDNEGNAPTDEKDDPGGPDAYFSSLPVKLIAEEIKRCGIPAAVSNTAGTFVCNSLMYGVLRFCALYAPKTQAGFIHVPCIPEQAADFPENTPTLPLEQIVTALQLALKVIAEEYQESWRDAFC